MPTWYLILIVTLMHILNPDFWRTLTSHPPHYATAPRNVFPCFLTPLPCRSTCSFSWRGTSGRTCWRRTFRALSCWWSGRRRSCIPYQLSPTASWWLSPALSSSPRSWPRCARAFGRGAAGGGSLLIQVLGSGCFHLKELSWCWVKYRRAFWI